MESRLHPRCCVKDGGHIDRCFRRWLIRHPQHRMDNVVGLVGQLTKADTPPRAKTPWTDWQRKSIETGGGKGTRWLCRLGRSTYLSSVAETWLPVWQGAAPNRRTTASHRKHLADEHPAQSNGQYVMSNHIVSVYDSRERGLKACHELASISRSPHATVGDDLVATAPAPVLQCVRYDILRALSSANVRLGRNRSQAW